MYPVFFRKSAMPFAEARGYLTDEKVLTQDLIFSEDTNLATIDIMDDSFPSPCPPPKSGREGWGEGA
jgi:hypothetical protein